MDTNRGTGRTTRQIMDAPLNAVFVACGHEDRGYAARLAASLDRKDIRIETPEFFEEKWHGMLRPVVIDHAAYRFFTSRQATGMHACKYYLEGHGLTCT